MAQPYNYMLDIPNPMESVNQSIASGFNLAAKTEQAQQQREQLALQKQQQSQMNQSLQYLAQNPSPENYAKVMTMYPQLSENLKRSYDTMDDGKRKTTLSIASQSYAALMNNQPDIAKQVLNDAATAYENSGQAKDAGVIRGYAKLIDNNPTAARTSIGLMMAATDPDKFKDIYGTIGSEQRANEMQPIAVKQANANVEKTKAETKDIAENAIDRRTGVLNDQRKTELQNQQFYDNLGQANRQFYDGLDSTNKIEAMKLASSKNETGDQRLTRLSNAEDYNTAAAQAADFAKTATKLANNADANAGLLNAVQRKIPGTSENTYAKDIEVLKSQVFLTQIAKMKGMGALTDAEGEQLRNSIASLDLNQDPKIVKQNIQAIATTMQKASQIAETKAQMYSSNGRGYSKEVLSAAKKRGVSPYEMQKYANELAVQ